MTRTNPPGGALVSEQVADARAPAALFARANEMVGAVTALVCCHCESVDSDIISTSVESFDRHHAVNVRATWLLIKAFAEQFDTTLGAGRIVALTSNHVAHNLPYGATKGAMDRVVMASAIALAPLGITANVVDPGATDTGWMSSDTAAAVLAGNLQSRIGTPDDCTNLVRFLCSPEGQWINGQILHSNGGVDH